MNNPPQHFYNYNKDEEKRTINSERQFTVLNKREFVLQAIESYRRLINQGKNPPIYEVKTRLQTLFMELRSDIKQDITAEEYYDLENNLSSDSPAKIFDALEFIEDWIHTKKLMSIFKPEVLL